MLLLLFPVNWCYCCWGMMLLPLPLLVLHDVFVCLLLLYCCLLIPSQAIIFVCEVAATIEFLFVVVFVTCTIWVSMLQLLTTVALLVFCYFLFFFLLHVLFHAVLNASTVLLHSVIYISFSLSLSLSLSQGLLSDAKNPENEKTTYKNELNLFPLKNY